MGATGAASALSERLRKVGAASPLVRRTAFRLRWSSTRRLLPLSTWGYQRGTAVDRHYIRQFLKENQEVIAGRVLEVKEDLYASVLGAERVDVLDIDPGNQRATIVGDVCDPDTLPVDVFDCALITQTLQLVPDPRAALENVLSALRPGGCALVTVPTTSRLAGDWDRWRWTAIGFEELIDSAGGTAEVRARGNQLTCRAFLFGAAMEDLPRAVWDADDPSYPLVVTAVIRRRS